MTALDLSPRVAGRRSVVDRRAVAAEAAAAMAAAPADARRRALVGVLARALAAGETELARRLAAQPARGLDHARGRAFLVDQIVRLAFDAATGTLYRLDNPTSAERVAMVAVGGYGRSELAPFSDVDLLFLSPLRGTAWVEQVVESCLYVLWDLGLKLGHAVRTVDETMRLAARDHEVATQLLEARWLAGYPALYLELAHAFRAWAAEPGRVQQFTADKIGERDQRHVRLGDSRYVVEPNVKEGKGGLRDLQALYWIGKFATLRREAGGLVAAGLFTREEERRFQRALAFLWTVRVHLHLVAERAEERLTFDFQRDLAERLGRQPRPGQSRIERFMRSYFLVAKDVGALTGLFLAHFDERFGRRGPAPPGRARRVGPFHVRGGQVELRDDAGFAQDPVRLIELFHLADREGLEIHPLTRRLAARDEPLITPRVRRDTRANTMFLDILASRRDPELVLRWMNETGVLGRFVPDFERVVARMQYDMYHHFTVDEHTIRAVGLLARLEKGELAADHPQTTAMIRHIVSRRALYVAVLLHDIAKGRGGDHSVLGADVARRLGPRLGLDRGETELVAWLVLHHLLMSATAFKRDLADPLTIRAFADTVQSVERLRLLAILTTIDIRAVGPNTWNGWKGQLLATLFDAAEEQLRLGHKARGRVERVATGRQLFQERHPGSAGALARHGARFYDSFWLAEPPDVVAADLELLDRVAANIEGELPVLLRPDAERGATLLAFAAPDHPGLFARLAGGTALAGASIVDARLHTTRDGLAVDNLYLQDTLGGPFDEGEALDRLHRALADALAGRVRLAERLRQRPLARRRQDAFRVAPQIFVDNRASGRLTVVEVHALDRPALLHALAQAFFREKASIGSAHITTYGERAVDTFYVTDLTGQKILSPHRLKALRARLLEAAEPPRRAQVAGG